MLAVLSEGAAPYLSTKSGEFHMRKDAEAWFAILPPLKPTPEATESILDPFDGEFPARPEAISEAQSATMDGVAHHAALDPDQPSPWIHEGGGNNRDIPYEFGG